MPRKYLGWLAVAVAVFAFMKYGPQQAAPRYGVLGIEDGVSE